MILLKGKNGIKEHKIKQALRHHGVKTYKRWLMLQEELKDRFKRNGVEIDLSGSLLRDIPKKNIKHLLNEQSLCFQIAKCESDIELIKEIISYGYKDEPKYKDDLKMVYEDTFIYGIKFSEIKKKLTKCKKTTMYRIYDKSFSKVVRGLKEMKIDLWENKNGSFVMDIDKRYFMKKNYEKFVLTQ